MSAPEPHRLLRPGLLERTRILVAGPPSSPPPGYGEATATACASLGALVVACRPAAAGALGLGEEAMEAAVAESLLPCDGAVELVVVDAAALFAAEEEGEESMDPLARSLQGTWAFLRVLGGRTLVEGDGGRIVLIAPPPGAGEHAPAARRALENLARTLSVEWARHRITAVAVAPGDRTGAGEVASLVAYLASPAGAYFSGCLLELGGLEAGG
jgi:citronellol/citronellal dehydrogenase